MDYLNSHLCSVNIFLPLAFGFTILCIPSGWRKVVKYFSLASSISILLLTVFCVAQVSGTGDFELVEKFGWIQSLGADYYVGLDGPAALLFVLVAIIVVVVVVAAFDEIDRAQKYFYAILFLFETCLFGVFASIDTLLFFMFWSVAALMLFFAIGVWSKVDKIFLPSFFIIVFCFAGALVFGAILYLWAATGSFSLISWYAARLSVNQQIFLFALFAVGFAVTIPLIFFQPCGMMLLGLSTVSVYGFYRFTFSLFPVATSLLAPHVATFAVVGIIVAATLAFVQTDIKKCVSYLFTSQMGFVVLGFSSINPYGVKGALLGIFYFGLTLVLLFYLTGCFCRKRNSQKIVSFGGMGRTSPILAVFYVAAIFVSIGIPGTSNFVGLFQILLGSFQTITTQTIFSLAGFVLLAISFVYLSHRIVFGKNLSEDNFKMTDITPHEFFLVLFLCIFIFVGGVWPKSFFERIEKSGEVFVKLATRVEMIIPAGVQ